MSTRLSALVKLLKERQAALKERNKKAPGPASTPPSPETEGKKGI